MQHHLTAFLVAVILLAGFSSNALAALDPLFQSDEPLALVLEMPPGNKLPTRKGKPTATGVLRYTSKDGIEVALDVAVSTRGHSRLELCSLPPLSFNLKRNQVASTLFAGQNKLKIVTLCRNSAPYRRYLKQEFLVYKILNILSEYSLRVRKLEITYRELGGRKPDKLHSAFVIESVDRAAARLGMNTIKVDSVKVSQLDAHQLSIHALFHYMIGNTDWAVRVGPPDEECCHNGKVLAPPDSNVGWVVIPYDFDQAGIINTSYALPDEKFSIRSVRQRLYRGFCSSNDQLDATVTMFNDRRPAIEGLFGGEPDGSSPDKKALRYLRDFYKTVNDPKKRQKRLVDVCQRTKK